MYKERAKARFKVKVIGGCPRVGVSRIGVVACSE